MKAIISNLKFTASPGIQGWTSTWDQHKGFPGAGYYFSWVLEPSIEDLKL